ncbi:deoxyribonuclease IV [Catelliglobosispora koreensis]|uniref:deoxyribonuclease IV n=1 Tax=Catelliglobosispora koreensis TaxID=129052 RepID=UPI0003816CAF|nr:deoxyribonuclease IV [Catelliglobosispora koreensis]
MRIGAHVDRTDPLAEAKARNADVVQFFLTDPQGFKNPEPREDAEAIRDSGLLVFIHAPYLVNVATANNRIRIPSRKLMQAHAEAAATLGAKGLIVHGGHMGKDADLADGFANWRKALQQHKDTGVQILIENTAGGDNACVRRFDDLARLWDAVGDLGVGFCLDTCHAHAGGEDLIGIVDRVKAITGRIDLVHANGSKDGFDSGRDRHDNLFGGGSAGTLDAALVAAVVKAAGAPAVVETPGGADEHSADIAYLRERL